MSSTSAPAAPQFVLRLFGPLVATVGEQPLPRLRSRKEEYLLCLLALRAPRSMERLRLAGILWPDSAEEQALYNLRRSLNLLRTALGQEHADRLHSPAPGTIALRLEGADIDVQTFDAALKTGTPDALEHAVGLYTAPLLEDSTEEWALTKRAAREEALLAACERCGTECAAAGDPPRAARFLRRALIIDPLRETTVRALMQTLADAGDTAGAMDVFRRFRRRLRREIDASPASETRALLGHITDALSPAPPASVRLPRPLTPLIGRRQEVRETVTALDAFRLVSLTGTGGVGKTRLVIAVAQDLSEEIEVGFVALAALTDTAPLAAAVASALSIAGPCDTSDDLIEHLRERSLLLVLDNCEHLVDGCASFVTALLEGCARLRFLATSRQPLGLPGEAVRPVPLLTLPPAQDTTRPETDYEAVQLFVARARAARSSFSPDPRTLPAIVRICRRLDGLPLALELAAARVRSFSCEQIAQKLDDRFGLLASGNRGALPRHQTLRAAVDWSYDLLTEAERLLLAQLSVFAGGWTLETAEAVCGEDDRPIEDALSSLVEKSLVQMQECDDSMVRYFLLETLREYGQEKLALTGRKDTLCVRHRDFFLALAEEAELHLRGPEQALWLSRLEEENDNLRAAMAYCREDENGVEEGLRICGALQRFWEIHGHFSEGRRWLSKALESARERGTVKDQRALLAKVLNGAGNLAYHQSDYGAARTFYEESLTLRRQVGDQHGIAASLNNLGNIACDQHDYRAAQALHEESLALRRQVKDRHGIASSLNNLANVWHRQGDDSMAQPLYEEGLTLFRELDEPHGIATLTEQLGTIAYKQQYYGAARTFYEEGLTLRRQLGDQYGVATSLHNLGNIACEQHDYGAALHKYRESLRLFQKMNGFYHIATILESLARLMGRCNQSMQAIHLLGVASSLREKISGPLSPEDQKAVDQQITTTREALGEATFSAAWESGRAMTLEQAVEYALQEEAETAIGPLPRETQSAGHPR